MQGPDVMWCLIFGGDMDWMDPSKGDEIVHALQAVGKRATSYRVMNAGHQLFLDDPEGTAKAMIKCIKHLERDKVVT